MDLLHSLKCWITMDNTFLVNDNFLEMWYQLIECAECKKQYVVFRTWWNTYLSLLDEKLMKKLNDFKLLYTEYFEIYNSLKNQWITLYSNIEKVKEYPVWSLKESVEWYSLPNWDTIAIWRWFYESLNFLWKYI